MKIIFLSLFNEVHPEYETIYSFVSFLEQKELSSRSIIIGKFDHSKKMPSIKGKILLDPEGILSRYVTMDVTYNHHLTTCLNDLYSSISIHSIFIPLFRKLIF